MKVLLRTYPAVLFQLAGCVVDSSRIRLEDTAINLPEQRADHVFILSDATGREEGAVCVEYQLQPRSDLLPIWFAKVGALGRQLGLPVLLLAVYLEKGDRASFPNSYSVELAGLSSNFQFPAVRLWEHADRIRNGELWALAPLLVLCEDTPGEGTLREEVALITRSSATSDEQRELLALALRVAGRRLPRPLVEAIFREELPMVQGATIIDDWIAEGEARGEARGKAQGRIAEAQRLTKALLESRFGELSERLTARIEQADVDACEALFRRALSASSLDELND